MPYGLIVLIGSVALVVYFNATEASWISKTVVSGLFIFSFATFFGWTRINPLIGLFLLAGLSVCILFYRACQEARWGK